MPVDRVDSTHDLQDAPRSTLKAAEPWQLQQEGLLAGAFEQAKRKKLAERAKRREARRGGGPLFQPNYRGKPRMRTMDAWKLNSSVVEIGKTESEHVGTIGERLCLQVTVESTKRSGQAAPAAEAEENAAPSEADDAEPDAHSSDGPGSAGSSRWLIIMMTEDGDRIGYQQVGAEAAKARVGSAYLLEADVAEHTHDDAGRAQTTVVQAQLVPMVGKCVARGTLRQWSDSGPAFKPPTAADATRRPSSASSSTRLGVSTSLLANKQVSHPWGRGTAPRSGTHLSDHSGADPRLRSLRREGHRARQEAVQAELSEHKLSSLLGILRKQGEEESVIDIVLDDHQPQLAAAKRAAMPLDSSPSSIRKGPSAAGLADASSKRRVRPSSAGAIMGGGLVTAGWSGQANEDTCMELLRSASRRPQSAAQARSSASVATARRHSLTTSSLSQTNTSGLVRKTAFLSHLYRNEHFAKTCSGQTWGSLKKDAVFRRACRTA
jgi:hypothetical protein